MPISLHNVEFFVLNMRTRIPFRYGIAELKAVPHLFCRAEIEVDGRKGVGISSEGLPPKWFTKNPAASFRDEIADMLHVIETAADFSMQIGSAPSVFDLWQQTYVEQMKWAPTQGYPPLLWSFGVTVIERALIEGFCRITGKPFAAALRENTLGIHLNELHGELKGLRPADLLPPEAARSIQVRHTVGLADPLTDADIPEREIVNDGLPQSLEAAIVQYGLTHFKIKLGQPGDDFSRLLRIAGIIDKQCAGGFQFTLDGNEFYKNVDAFRADWERLIADPRLQSFLRGLLFVEQPLHRDAALSVDAADDLLEWESRPPMIIDESDAHLGSCAEAIESGYVGTSHKNCKGVFKGVANACLLEHRRRAHPEFRAVISGEDLCSVGPVAMIQDLAVVANLGLTHVERNGHHYFRGLSMYPAEIQEQVMATMGDVYAKHPAGFATLNLRGGQLRIGSVVDAPLGTGFDLDPRVFTPLEEWMFQE